MNIQRVLLGLAAIVFAGGVVISGTGAFFSDEETSTGNVFAAGDIDLQIDNESYVTSTTTGVLVASPATSWDMTDLVAGTHKFFDFEDLKPGDVGEDTISIHVGSNDAWMCAAARITSDEDNSITEPEDEVSGASNDDNDGTPDGDLDNAVNFAFWHDDGDNVLEDGEDIFLEGPLSGLGAQGQITLADSSGGILGSNTPIPGDSTFYIGKAWCYGTLARGTVAQDALGKTGTNGPLVRGTGVTCDGSAEGNIGQTDSVEGDMQFYAVQSRNNSTFTCAQNYTPTWPTVTPPGPDGEVNQLDLATSTADIVARPDSWFFYNDTNDTVMTIDQFSGTGGQNHMELVAGEEGAKMVLDTGVNPRYNIATAQFSDVLNTISSLKFRVYDGTVDSDTPFLQFNVDFATTTITGGFQNRLVMLPGAGGNAALPAATWTTVDGLGTAMWTWSGLAKGPDKTAATADDNTWPDGSVAVYRSWNDIVAAFPNAKLLAPGSFLGVRTGQPGPAGATNFVSSIEFDGTVYNFEI